MQRTHAHYRTLAAALVVAVALAAALAGCDKHSKPYELELTHKLTDVLGKDFTKLPDKGLVDQNGKPFTFAQTKGKPVLVTSIYTRCPMPNMCPLITSKVARVQTKLADDGVSTDKYSVVLLSFDPAHDTPQIMTDYAKEHGVKLDNSWLITGNKTTLKRDMDRLEVIPTRQKDGTIMHNMRTYVIGADGKIATGFRQSRWQPAHVAQRIEELVD